MIDQYGDTPTMLYFFGATMTGIGIALIIVGFLLIWRAHCA